MLSRASVASRFVSRVAGVAALGMAACGGGEATVAEPLSAGSTVVPALVEVSEPTSIETVAAPTSAPDTVAREDVDEVGDESVGGAPADAAAAEGSLSAVVTIDGTRYDFGDPAPEDVTHYAFCILQETYGYLGAEVFAVGEDGGLADGTLNLDLQPTDSADSDGITRITVMFDEGPSYAYEGPLDFRLDAGGASGSVVLTSSVGTDVEATFAISC